MKLDREWEKFNGGPTQSLRDRLHVTLSKKGIILMNRNAHRLIGKPEGVNLYYHRKTDTIAIEPAHARLPLVFPVKERFNYLLIHALPFCKHFGIRVDSTQAFVRPDISEHGMLMLDLSNTVTVGGWRRKDAK
jgi:hypothetical protein